MSAPIVEFVCPRCKGELAANSTSYRCDSCAITYPILFGIPDFRLRSDRYLSLEDERAKARRLHEIGQNASVEELVQFYYSISDDLPRNMAQRYQAATIAAPERARHIVRDLAPKPGSDILVELGCGTGGLLVAAQGCYRAIYGVDIALRWLVVCKKRLQENNATATLVCADVESLPFPNGRFTQAVAADLVEHVYDVENTVREIARIVEPSGLLWLSAVNRYCVGPHPLTGVWAIGFPACAGANTIAHEAQRNRLAAVREHGVAAISPRAAARTRIRDCRDETEIRGPRHHGWLWRARARIGRALSACATATTHARNSGKDRSGLHDHLSQAGSRERPGGSWLSLGPTT